MNSLYDLFQKKWNRYFIGRIYAIKQWWRHQMVFRAERNALKKRVYIILEEHNIPLLKKWFLWKKFQRELRKR